MTKGIYQDYIQQKFQSKLQEKLPDVLGDDVTDKLQKFGILPTQKKTAPTAPVPAEESGTTGQPVPSGEEAAPTAQEPQPAPAPVKEELKRPEDAVNDILQGGDPEEALQGVIKGLF